MMEFIILAHFCVQNLHHYDKESNAERGYIYIYKISVAEDAER